MKLGVDGFLNEIDKVNRGFLLEINVMFFFFEKFIDIISRSLVGFEISFWEVILIRYLVDCLFIFY